VGNDGIYIGSTPLSERWDMNEFSDLRRLADETLQVAAARIGVSSTKLWNFENGIANATLTPEQTVILRRSYAQRIKKRLERVSAFLPAE
jgi:DNA-binding XRE family transcriptional regulator